MNNKIIIGIFMVGISAFSFAQKSEPIVLPSPQMKGGLPLFETLKIRKSVREFSEQKPTQKMLSNLLWCAYGINRSEAKKRTAPSAMNLQMIEIYVCLDQGTFLYDPEAHALKLVLSEDIRESTGFQPFVKVAPVNLVYVADLSKIRQLTEDTWIYIGAEAGAISQNVYLFCASEGLATVVRGAIPRDVLAQKLKLKDTQKIILAQTVGYPTK